MRKLILTSLLSIAAASAQSLSIGVVGGAPFTDLVTKNAVGALQSIPKSTNFTVGPALQVNLPASFRLEVDALYRPYDFDNYIGSRFAYTVSGQQFRFPVLLQYRFGAPVVKPFIEAGLSYDHLSALSAAAKGIVASGPGQLLHQSDASVVLGAGVEAKIPFVRISGELRYTRQTVSNFASFSNLNQAEVLIGVHF